METRHEAAREDGALIPGRGEESIPRRKHRKTGRPRGGARPDAGRKKGERQTRIEKLAAESGWSVRTIERAERVKECSPTLWGVVASAYQKARKAGHGRSPGDGISWTWADRHVGKIRARLRQGRSIDAIATAQRLKSHPGQADFHEKVVREVADYERRRALLENERKRESRKRLSR